MKKRSCFLLIVLCAAFRHCVAQPSSISVGIPYVGLGAYSKQQADVFSFTNNQAALAQNKTTAVGFYGERRFMLSEAGYYAAAFAFHSRLGNFGINLNHAGFKNFAESQIGLAYARNLGAKVDVGIQFGYYGHKIPGYGSAEIASAALGLIMHFSERFHGGLHVSDPIAIKIPGNKDDASAAVYKMGFGYDASAGFFVSIEISKEEEKSLNVLAGMQYSFAKQFFVRAGFLSVSTTGFAGIGFKLKKIRIDMSSSFHPQLGISPGMLLIVNNEKK